MLAKIAIAATAVSAQVLTSFEMNGKNWNVYQGYCVNKYNQDLDVISGYTIVNTGDYSSDVAKLRCVKEALQEKGNSLIAV